MEYLIPIFTGNPPTLTTGLDETNVKFYRDDDDTQITISVVEADTGIYRCAGFADDESVYTYMKVNTVENNSFKRQWLGGLPALQKLKGITEVIQTALNDTLRKSVANQTQSKTIYLNNDGVNPVEIIMNQDELGNYGTPSNDGSLINFKYLKDNYGSGAGTPLRISAKFLIVDSGAVAVTGKIYTTIQGAISYAVSQTPTSTAIWIIYIMPNHTETGYVEDITYARYVYLVGWGEVKINGSLTKSAETWTGYDTKLINLKFKKTDVSYDIKNFKAFNCSWHSNGAGGEVNLLFDSVILNVCDFITQNDVNIEVANTNKINVVKNCNGNASIPWLSTDKVHAYDYITGYVEEL